MHDAIILEAGNWGSDDVRVGVRSLRNDQQNAGGEKKPHMAKGVKR